METAVNTLAEEQALPFGIDDALNQFEQCTQVLALIDMPHLAQITQYSAELMRQIMAQPQQIKTTAGLRAGARRANGRIILIGCLIGLAQVQRPGR